MQRSTGKASKLRRDQINSEIETLRHLLPLPSAVKARLSYLQVMSLACVYIRTGNFFSSYTKGMDQEHHYTSLNGGGVLVDAWMVGNESNGEMTRSSSQTSSLATVEITQALSGFLLLVRPSGKILHVSENVIDHLGHSMVRRIFLLNLDILRCIYKFQELMSMCGHALCVPLENGKHSYCC
ncbi:neuronal PAS domain-containing protein 4B-like [Strongylocentrotus purpuratus]|uniref:BHLH domain-containing protein n=1 Tax=Strongylocentrotus purpuratus TaxID=7668 RepID=A0A7M7PQN7_STRPU|nr:neuronal PAS domain-containing protein 4B-like [Strongylocentrotus purpuratus]